MNYILFDDPVSRLNLLPFTFTRPVADIRIGILTIREKWSYFFNAKDTVSTFTEEYLQEKFPLVIQSENILINSSILPSAELLSEINSLKFNQALMYGKTIVAIRVSDKDFKKCNSIHEIKISQTIPTSLVVFKLEYSWEIFAKNEDALLADFKLITHNRKSQPISKTNTIIGDSKNIFLEEGAKVECALLNVTDGVIYVGKDAEIMEGSMLRGSFSLGEHSVIKLGTKIYGPTTIGPHSKVGGEINNSVIFGYSNKAHDGFLGNSVIGEWCNLGADTNNSNLKNNYSNVKVWNYAAQSFVDSGLQFCGLMMGDHSKCAINTMFNTGTVVGVNANIFGSGFPAKFVPCFSWDGANSLDTYNFEQACAVAQKVFERRKMIFSETEKNILNHIFEITAKYRYWEKEISK